MFRAIYHAKTNLGHILSVRLLVVLLTFLIMNYLATFVLWAFVGDGAYPRSWDKWLELTYGLSATVLLYPILFYRIYVNYKRGKLPRAKSYVFALPIIPIASAILFHVQIPIM